MCSEWTNTTWGEVATLEYGKALRDYHHAVDGYPVYGTNGPIGFHDTALCNTPGVVIGRKGAYRGVHFSPQPFFVIDTAFYLRPKSSIDMKWAYYALLSCDINGMDSGSAIPSTSRDEFYKLPVTVPLLSEQVRIAEFLSQFDERITLLRETNATLEAIAQALFKSWFVDFDPVRAKMEGRVPEGMDEATASLFPDSFEETELGEVPRGWSRLTMEDVSTVGIGKTPPRKEQHWFSENPSDIRWVSIRDMGAETVYAAQTSEFLTTEAVERFNVRRVPDNTVLMSFKMTIGRVAITDGEMTTNEAIAHFKLGHDALVSTEYIYLHLKHFDFSTLSSTSSIADAVNSKTVREIPVLVPNRAVSTAFTNKVWALFSALKNTEQQAKTLSKLRDSLLPRLISGRIQLGDKYGVENSVDISEI
ncbi:MAG: restriction endonuclease subunit S [Pseudomonadota bacterium]